MSFPVPISAITALDTPKRESSHVRNVSSPYSLTFPPGKRPWTARPTSPAAASSIYSEYGSEAFFEPTYPQKALIYSEKALHPYDGDDDSSRSNSISSKRYRQVSSSEPTKRQRKPWWKGNDRLLALTVTITLLVLLSIAIPLGVLLPQKYIEPLPINVLMPPTVFPDEVALNRLTDSYVLVTVSMCPLTFPSIINHPDLDFTIVINPDNGPGSNITPSDEYVKAVKILNVYPNVMTLGWVDTQGGKRDNATIRMDIERYSNWSSVEGLALHGIYLDRTPYRDEDSSSIYMKNVSATVRESQGFLGTNLVVHNPGRVPDKSMMECGANITVVYDGGYEYRPTREQLKNSLEGMGKREEFAMLVDSTPQDIERVDLRRLVENVKRDVEWLYVTDINEGSYGVYGSLWEQFLDLVW
jgi:hypothetical protein